MVRVHDGLVVLFRVRSLAVENALYTQEDVLDVRCIAFAYRRPLHCKRPLCGQRYRCHHDIGCGRISLVPIFTISPRSVIHSLARYLSFLAICSMLQPHAAKPHCDTGVH